MTWKTGEDRTEEKRKRAADAALPRQIAVISISTCTYLVHLRVKRGCFVINSTWRGRGGGFTVSHPHCKYYSISFTLFLFLIVISFRD